MTNDVDMFDAKRIKTEYSGGEPGPSLATIPSFLDNLPPVPGHDRPADEFIMVTKASADPSSAKVNAIVKGNLDRMPTRREFNQALVLRKDEQGDYYPPPLAFDRIPVPGNLQGADGKLRPGKENWDALMTHRDNVWAHENLEMGITTNYNFTARDKRIPLNNKKRLDPKHRIIKVGPYEEKVTKRYMQPFQAGSEMPHIMVKTQENDVHTIWRDARDKYKGKTFAEFKKDMTDTFGQEPRIYLKSPAGIMRDSENMEAYERGSADVRFAEFAGEYRTHNRQLPAAVVNVGGWQGTGKPLLPDKYVSVAFFMRHAPDCDWAQSLKRGEKWDRVQLLKKDGNGYQSLARLNYTDERHSLAIMKEVGLPITMGENRLEDTIKHEAFARMAPVLVLDGPILKDARHETPENNGKILPAQTLIADVTTKYHKTGHQEQVRTGGYTSVAEYERTQKELPADAAKVLNQSPDVYSRHKIKPDRDASRSYREDDRSRQATYGI